MSTSRPYIVTLLILLLAEYIMWDAGLDESQGRVKIARRNINNLRYVDDTTLMEESDPFHVAHGPPSAGILNCFAIPSPVKHILSELSTLICVALPTVTHSFIELHKPLCPDKSVTHEEALLLIICKSSFYSPLKNISENFQN